MVTLKMFAEILPGTLIDFQEDSWIQVYDDNTNGQYRSDDNYDIYLNGKRIAETYVDLLKREISYVEQHGEYLAVYLK